MLALKKMLDSTRLSFSNHVPDSFVVWTAIVIVAGSLIKLYLRKHAK